MVNGPSCMTGLTLMVTTPTWPSASEITAAIMIAGGAAAHLEHAIALAGARAVHIETAGGKPGGERVGTEMSLHDEVRGSIGAQPRQPLQQQLVQGLLAEPHRRI